MLVVFALLSTLSLTFAQIQIPTVARQGPTQFCPKFITNTTACQCYSYVDGAVIECDGPGGPEIVEKLKSVTNIDIRQLSIKNADIIEIGPRAFRNLRIRSLVLDDNRIRKIHPDAFRGLEFSLLHLSISRNKLTEIPTDALIGMQNLQILNLKCNNIGDIYGEVFRNTSSIIELNLACNQICKISRNALNGVKARLQSLIMDNNCLKEVPAETLRGFTNLLALHLQYNEITGLKKLQFMNLLNLIMVRLTGNKIRTIDRQAFNNIPNLRYLFLDKNQLTSVDPNTLQQFHLLEIVDLSYNNIAEIPSGAFSNINRLMQLNLQGNMITDIQPGAFAGTPLFILLLTDNCLASVSPQTFQGLQFLRQLSLSHNNIRVIQQGAFSHLPNLQLVDLSSNRLESLPNAVFSFSDQATILLQENPIVCLQGFHLIQGGQSLLLLQQEDKICKEPNIVHMQATCPTRKTIPPGMACCSKPKPIIVPEDMKPKEIDTTKFIKDKTNPPQPVVKTTNSIFSGLFKTITAQPQTIPVTTTTMMPKTMIHTMVKTMPTTVKTMPTSTKSPMTTTRVTTAQPGINLERFWRLTAPPRQPWTIPPPITNRPVQTVTAVTVPLGTQTELPIRQVETIDPRRQPIATRNPQGFNTPRVLTQTRAPVNVPQTLPPNIIFRVPQSINPPPQSVDRRQPQPNQNQPQNTFNPNIRPQTQPNFQPRPQPNPLQAQFRPVVNNQAPRLQPVANPSQQFFVNDPANTAQVPTAPQWQDFTVPPNVDPRQFQPLRPQNPVGNPAVAAPGFGAPGSQTQPGSVFDNVKVERPQISFSHDTS